jgi:hypothetical protein
MPYWHSSLSVNQIFACFKIFKLEEEENTTLLLLLPALIVESFFLVLRCGRVAGWLWAVHKRFSSWLDLSCSVAKISN